MDFKHLLVLVVALLLPSGTEGIFITGAIVGAAWLGSAAVTYLGVPVAVGAIGFTSAGIVGGSTAAGMMSSAAILNGGAVAAGSVVAVCQSVGVSGVAASTASAVGGAVATAVAAMRVLPR